MGPWSILHLISSDRWTGAAEPATNLVLGLRARGHRVRLGIIRGRSFEERASAIGVDLLTDLHLHRGVNPLKQIADSAMLARIVRRDGVQLIHCHMNADHWLTALTRRLRRLRVSLVRTQHRITGERWPGFQRLLWRRLTDAVVVVSERQLVRSCPTHLIRGAVDTDLYHPGQSGAAVRDALGIPHGAPVVGMISHFKAGRGWSTAIPAFIEAHRRHPETHFLLAGGHSRLVRWIRARMREAGCFSQTHIISDRRFAWQEVLAAMDMGVWLAPQSDGSGRAMLEVMATGRPVVAGALATAPEVITDGENGRLVPVGVTPSRLSTVICELIEDSDKRGDLGRAARATIERDHTLDRQVGEVEQLYASLIP